MRIELGQGAPTNANLDRVSFELTVDMTEALGGELHHATNMRHLPLIFKNDLNGQKRVGTMACYAPHFDERCSKMQRTGKGNKIQDAIISYDGTEAVLKLGVPAGKLTSTAPHDHSLPPS